MSADKGSKLGRGIAALLGEQSRGSRDTNLQELAVTLLEPNPHQPRRLIDSASLAELTDSIRVQGVLQPLLVRPSPALNGRFQIVAGERRWRAATAAGLPTVACVVRTLDDQQSAMAAMVENLQRLDLNAIEEAEGLLHLTNRFQLTQDRAAEVVGKSRSYVANTLRLLRLPEPVKLMVRNGSLSAGHAKALLSHPDPEAAAELVLSRGLSVRQAEALVEHPIRPRLHKPEETIDVNTTEIETDLADHLGMTVRLREHDGRGQLTLRFTRLEQLDYILARLGPNRTAS